MLIYMNTMIIVALSAVFFFELGGKLTKITMCCEYERARKDD